MFRMSENVETITDSDSECDSGEDSPILSGSSNTITQRAMR